MNGEQQDRVGARELGRLLRAFRERQKKSREAVEAELPDEVKQRFGGVAEIEDASDGTLRMSNGDLEAIADTWGIPKLMLDPLLSERVDEVCLVEALKESEPVGRAGMAKYGTRAHYRIPKRKLRDTEEVAIVHLELEPEDKVEPGGHSDSHTHCGDELLFVLGEGTVEVRLEDSGLWTRLGPGGYVHFYAEQRHSAWNIGPKPVRLFIIRFYQLESPGTRFAYLEALKATNPNRNLISRVVEETKAALAPFDMRDGQTDSAEIRDRFGLARLLKRVCGPEFRGKGNDLSRQDLADRAAAQQLSYKRSWFDRLHHGQAEVPVADVPVLAKKIYEIEPMLLYDFVFPVQRNAVAVRWPDDFRPVPESFLGAAGVSYQVPCRRLAHSDIAIARLQLEPGASTPADRHRHPGQELLVPLQGVCEVRFGNVRAPLDAREHRYAHYLSHREHQVVNVGTEPAEHLVLRFYE
jgi:quercetin dioxygenase-like cupin family protein